MQTIRFGIIDTHFITERFISGLNKVSGISLEAICSRTEERVLSFAKQYSIQHTFTDLEEMAAIKPLHMPNFKVLEQQLHRIGMVRKYFASFCQYSSRYDAFRRGDMTATILYSKISDSTLTSEIQGEEGTLSIEKISQFHKVVFKPRRGEVIDLSVGQEKEDLCYEIQDFVDLVRENNTKQMDEWLREASRSG